MRSGVDSLQQTRDGSPTMPPRGRTVPDAQIRGLPEKLYSNKSCIIRVPFGFSYVINQ